MHDKLTWWAHHVYYMDIECVLNKYAIDPYSCRPIYSGPSQQLNFRIPAQ